MNVKSLGASVVVNLPTAQFRSTQFFPFSTSPPHLPKLNTTTINSRRTSTSVKTAVAAVESVEKQQESNKKYYFVVANAKFMLDEEEHFQEQLFERLRMFGNRNMEQDFWLVIEPNFLDNFPRITNRLSRPAVALVSTNAAWIKFMKLRLDRVLLESYEAQSLEQALASNPAKLKFDKPDKWVAPYPKYESGWWEPFLPPTTQKQTVSGINIVDS